MVQGNFYLAIVYLPVALSYCWILILKFFRANILIVIKIFALKNFKINIHQNVSRAFNILHYNNFVIAVPPRRVAAPVPVPEHNFLRPHPPVPGPVLPFLRAVGPQPHIGVQSGEHHHLLHHRGG